MLTPHTFFAPHLGARPGELGLQVCLWGEAGPQGNPLGTAQPRPYPGRDPMLGCLSFGPRVLPMGAGTADWYANVLPGAGSRSSSLVNTYVQPGVIKRNTPIMSF